MDIQNNNIQCGGLGALGLVGKLGKGNMGKLGRLGGKVGSFGLGVFWGKTQVKIFLIAAVISYIVSVAYDILKTKKSFSFSSCSCMLSCILVGFVGVGALAVVGGLPIPGPQVKVALLVSWILAIVPICCLSSTLASAIK